MDGAELTYIFYSNRNFEEDKSMIVIGVALTIYVVILLYVVGIFLDREEIAMGIIVSVVGLLIFFAICFLVVKEIEPEQTTTEQTTEQATEQSQWSEWQEAEDSFLLQEVEEDTYVVEQDDETQTMYVFHVPATEN